MLQLQQYQYYSAGLLSSHDPYYEQQRHLVGPKKKKFKEEKKLKGKHDIDFSILKQLQVLVGGWPEAPAVGRSCDIVAKVMAVQLPQSSCKMVS